LPVEFVWTIDFPTEQDAFLFERQVKGWTRAKKEALIRGDWNQIHEIVKTERDAREKAKRSLNMKETRPSTARQKTRRSAQDAH
jgi:hypothetical protein